MRIRLLYTHIILHSAKFRNWCIFMRLRLRLHFSVFSLQNYESAVWWTVCLCTSFGQEICLTPTQAHSLLRNNGQPVPIKVYDTRACRSSVHGLAGWHQYTGILEHLWWPLTTPHFQRCGVKPFTIGCLTPTGNKHPSFPTGRPHNI
jgi:hypothetical protein